MTDADWMRRCLELARRAEGKTSPNPIVGSVVLDKNGKLVGEGFHAKAGEAHAEKEALANAGAKARGGTLYVSLEPCRHIKNRRTAPCAPLVKAAGVARVVIGMADPIRSHAGGARWLADQGISVTRGILEEECKEANRAFITWARKKRPYFVLKAATSLDGKIATASGESQWITGAEARRHGRRLRSVLDAIVVGIGTVLADDPQLTARNRGGRDPVRVVLDSRLRTPLQSRLLPGNSRSKARTIVVATGKAAMTRERRLIDVGAEVWRVEDDDGRPRLSELATRLASEGLCSALVEGGAKVHAAFVDAGLCDELRMYLAPKAIGADGVSWLGALGVEALIDAQQLRWHQQPVLLGNDLLLVARP